LIANKDVTIMRTSIAARGDPSPQTQSTMPTIRRTTILERIYGKSSMILILIQRMKITRRSPVIAVVIRVTMPLHVMRNETSMAISFVPENLTITLTKPINPINNERC